MSKFSTLKAVARERVGKGSSRELRRNGMVPAVIYGDKKEPLSIAIPYKETFLNIHAGGFRTNILTIELDNKKIQVLPKDYQLDPVRDFLVHVDFLRVSAKSVVTVNIPVHFLNEESAPGLKKGGVLNVVRHEVEVIAPAAAIPDNIEVDLTGYEVGDSIHISAVKLPKDIELTITDRDFTIATIAPPDDLSAEDEGDVEASAETTEE